MPPLRNADPAPRDSAPLTVAPRAAVQGLPFHHFVVEAVAGPGVLPRAVDLFAKRGLVLAECRAVCRPSRRPGGPEHQTLEMKAVGLDPQVAAHIAACLRQIVGVETVWSFETDS